MASASARHGARRPLLVALVALVAAVAAVIVLNGSSRARTPVGTTALAWIHATSVGDTAAINALTLDHDSDRPYSENPYLSTWLRGYHCWIVVHGGACQPVGLIGEFPYRSVDCVATSETASSANVECHVHFHERRWSSTQDLTLSLGRVHGGPWIVTFDGTV